MNKLKPCPFCGGVPSRDQKRVADYVPSVWKAVIYCPSCRANIEITYAAPRWAKNPEVEAKKAVAKLWNRRYPNEDPETRQG